MLDDPQHVASYDPKQHTPTWFDAFAGLLLFASVLLLLTTLAQEDFGGIAPAVASANGAPFATARMP